jgi:UDPglucose 6-dehydrogenase
MAEDLGGLSGKLIAVWGLAFKPRTDDVREAPALHLIEELDRQGARVCATDPEALETARAALSRLSLRHEVRLTPDAYAACEGADALVIATEWNEYRNPDLKRIGSLLRQKLLFDGRNILMRDAALEAGFRYRGIGRPPS